MAVKGAVNHPEDTVLCGCTLSAKVKIRTESGLENMCMGCYYKHYYRQSLEYCAGLGLDATADRIAWLRKHASGITKRYTRSVPTTREPGEDLEEATA